MELAPLLTFPAGILHEACILRMKANGPEAQRKITERRREGDRAGDLKAKERVFIADTQLASYTKGFGKV